MLIPQLLRNRAEQGQHHLETAKKNGDSRASDAVSLIAASLAMSGFHNVYKGIVLGSVTAEKRLAFLDETYYEEILALFIIYNALLLGLETTALKRERMNLNWLATSLEAGRTHVQKESPKKPSWAQAFFASAVLRVQSVVINILAVEGTTAFFRHELADRGAVIFLLAVMAYQLIDVFVNGYVLLNQASPFKPLLEKASTITETGTQWLLTFLDKISPS